VSEVALRGDAMQRFFWSLSSPFPLCHRRSSMVSPLDMLSLGTLPLAFFSFSTPTQMHAHTHTNAHPHAKMHIHTHTSAHAHTHAHAGQHQPILHYNNPVSTERCSAGILQAFCEAGLHHQSQFKSPSGCHRSDTICLCLKGLG